MVFTIFKVLDAYPVNSEALDDPQPEEEQQPRFKQVSMAARRSKFEVLTG